MRYTNLLVVALPLVATVHYAGADLWAALAGKEIDPLIQPPPTAAIVNVATTTTGTSTVGVSSLDIALNTITDEAIPQPAVARWPASEKEAGRCGF